MRRVVSTIVIVLVAVAVVAGIGFTGFRLGTNYGISQSPQIAAAIENMPRPSVSGDGPDMVYGGGPGFMHYGGGWGPHMGGFRGGFGGGFGFLGCLIPLFFLFLVFGLLRFAFRPWGWSGRHWGGWRGGPGGPGGHGPWGGQGVPPHFEEWHKRAHGEAPATPVDPNTPPTSNA
jgi:hypothetical protein